MSKGHYVGIFKSAVVTTALLLCVTVGKSRAEGPVTSRLTTAKFSLMKGNWGSDHNTTTPNTFKWMTQIMKDSGVTVVDTFNLGSSQAPLTAANLANYDVMVWYNVYRMMEFFSPAQATADRIQDWFENGNKGLACFHQCVRHSGWDWWGEMMGREYDTYANITTGPVFLDGEGFSEIYGSTSPDTVGQSYSWNDEWYIYAGNPRGTPGTKMLWTTKRSAFSSGFNMSEGEDKPIAWIREYNGGRFALNGMFHTNVVSNTTNPALRSFLDRTFIGTMRFLAGYDGCTDPGYEEYNAKATHMGANACVTPVFVKVGSVGAGERIRIDDFKISFSQPGRHSVEIYTTAGAKVAYQRGEGAREYRFSEIRQPGVYYVRVTTAGMKTPYTRKVVLL